MSHHDNECNDNPKTIFDGDVYKNTTLYSACLVLHSSI